MYNRNFFEDVDLEEIREWFEVLELVLEQEGFECVGWLLEIFINEVQEQGVICIYFDIFYFNIICFKDEVLIFGDIYME